MTEVIGTGAQIVNQAYAAKFAATDTKEIDNRIATKRTNCPADVLEFQMQMATVM